MRTTWRRALGGLVGMGIVTTTAAPAHAEWGDDFRKSLANAVVVGVTTFAIVVIGDSIFVTYDLVVAGKNELPSRGWAIAETVFTIPQTIIGHYAYARQWEGVNADGLPVFALVPTITASMLSTHGIWATATTEVRPTALMGISAAVGINATLTTGVLVRTFTGHLSRDYFGIAGMILTTPQLITASYLGATSPPSSRAGWIALSAWSGGLFVHGLASSIAGYHDGETSTPPPPPETASNSRPHLMVPESLRVGPMLVTDGVASAPGIGVSGVLF